MSFTDPENNIKQFKLGEGMIVADLGAGSGFYTIPAGRAVGSSGKVYAIEVKKDFLSKIKNDATKAHVFNVEVIWGNIEKIGGTKLRQESVDAVIVSNTLFQLEDKRTLVDEVKRILKPAGKILVIDWSDSFSGLGPRPEDIISKEKAKELFQKNGFKIEREISSGENHYGFIAKVI